MGFYRFLHPKEFVPDVATQWTYARKSSGVPVMYITSAVAADTNVILQIPIPLEVDTAGVGRAIKDITLHHFISATSAGVAPIISGSVALYEVTMDASKVDVAGLAVGVSANMATLPNATTSAGYIAAQQVSGVLISPTTLSAAGIFASGLWTSGQNEVFTVGRAPAYGGQESDKTHPYIPRLSNQTWVLEISASVGASAIWEIYGATVQYY